MMTSTLLNWAQISLHLIAICTCTCDVTVLECDILYFCPIVCGPLQQKRLFSPYVIHTHTHTRTYTHTHTHHSCTHTRDALKSFLKLILDCYIMLETFGYLSGRILQYMYYTYIYIFIPTYIYIVTNIHTCIYITTYKYIIQCLNIDDSL